jgi:gamma-glutamyl-gamma-aminobutyrate hydrolase PuuD/phosphohistidine swiveling domain-containing protein
MEQDSIISTKANTLYALSKILTRSKIEEMFILYIGDYEKDKLLVCHQIMDKFRGTRIVVRSSYSNEDSMQRSNAGRYKSILDVDSSNDEQIMNSIEEVIRSYRKDSSESNESFEYEQVLIQRQSEDVVISGVLFSRDIHGNRPYYLINYDDNGSTDSVTSGQGGSSLWIARDCVPSSLPSPWQELILSVQEAESILDGLTIDVEFAINSRNEITLFQIRPLVASIRQERNMEDAAYFSLKKKLKEQYLTYENKLDHCPMMFSDMAFWNPSEIIGANPHPLDYSLYLKILTSHAWNEGIRVLGYRTVNEDLMYQLGNKPYISLDYSFYSLIPSDLPEYLVHKLVALYKKRLTDNPTSHDKIEFEIIYNTYDFCTDKNTLSLLNEGWSNDERNILINSLRKLTIHTISNQREYIRDDLDSLHKLELMRLRSEEAFQKEISAGELVNEISRLIDGICYYGTPQFARQARIAFMSRAFCRSLVESSRFTEDEMDSFMSGVTTVSSEFEHDFKSFTNGQLSKKEFDKKYGHLRSGTYDILSDCYADMNFRSMAGKHPACADEHHISSTLNYERLQAALTDSCLPFDAIYFCQFLKMAIEQREFFKFEFTRSLSLVLEMIKKLGTLIDIKRQDLCWLTIDDILKLRGKVNELSSDNDLEKLIAKRKELHKQQTSLILPDVITGPISLDMIFVYEARPNFITSKVIEGEVVNLEEEPLADISGKIVAVTKADPGFEWIFAKGIKGFITKYGGAASHMAIRCAEFEIPAAIGCGEKIYSQVSKMSYIELDCNNGKISEGIQYSDLHALITQREGTNQYGDFTDVLESAYIRFYELMGFIPKPVSNHTKNFEKLFDEPIDLLIVVGGGALNPSLYDRPHNEELQPHRDVTEEKLIRYCIAHKIPIIATCRGMQYVNVLLGGRLHYHPQLNTPHPRGVDHPVYLINEKRTIMVNNYHNDCIYTEDLAPCLTPFAVDTDNNVVEAYVSEEMKILGLQWHPERPFETSLAYEETRKIIMNFMNTHIK